MSNLDLVRGRQVVEWLTNQSGGAVAAGDVVYLDTSHDASFTTGTTGGYTGSVGVAFESIASGATGRVLVSGYCPVINVNAAVTRGNFGKTHTVAKEATDAGSARGAGTFCQWLSAGTTPQAHLFGQPDIAASAGDSGWTAFTYQNGWASFGSGYSPGSFRKDGQGFVHLRGALAAAGATGNVIATLPAGYRPGATAAFTVSNGGGTFTELDISTAGALTLSVHTFGPFLDGITFLAEN